MIMASICIVALYLMLVPVMSDVSVVSSPHTSHLAPHDTRDSTTHDARPRRTTHDARR